MTRKTLLKAASEAVGVQIGRSQLMNAIKIGHLDPCEKVGNRNRYEQKHLDQLIDYLRTRSVTVFEACQ